MNNATETIEAQAPDQPHPFATELHPEWCSYIGCGCHSSTTAEATGIPDPGDDHPPVAIVAAVMDELGNRWVDLVAEGMTSVEVRLTPAAALEFAAAIVTKARLALEPCRMETRDMATWLREVAVAS